MVAKPLYYNWGRKTGIVLYPKWDCDNKLPPSQVRQAIHMKDRDDGPNYGDGPVFIAHHYFSNVPGPENPDGYRWYTGSATSWYLYKPEDVIISSGSQPFFESEPRSRLAFEYVGWYIFNDVLYEFELKGRPSSEYTGQYSFDRLESVYVTRFPAWGESNYVDRTTRRDDLCDRLGGEWGLSKYNNVWYSALKGGSLSAIYACLCNLCTHASDFNWGGLSSTTIGVIGFSQPKPEPCDLNKFVFPKGQYYYWLNRVHDMSGNISDGLKTAFFCDAYYKAIDQLPKLKQNLLANILDIVGALKSFKSGYKAIYSAKEFASSSWLAYRYAYSTTISDLEEATNYCGRLYNLIESEATVVRSYGTHLDNGAVYCCAVECDFSQLMSSSLSEKLGKQYNLRLSATNVWDMIPYSFVVDWFLGIGDVLGEIDQWLDSASLPVTKIWYSYKESYFTPTGDESVYFRWQGQAPSLPYFTELYSSKSNSAVTLVKRGLDSLALLF